jgi:putative glutamine amidotransferase
VGIPWRTTEEERAGKREKLDYYFAAVKKAGAEPVEISLEQSPVELGKQLDGVDAFVLPGSPADVDPSRYGEARHSKTKELDANRDGTDDRILSHAFRSSKPVLAICYGCQILNVHLKGTLVQDIPAEKPTPIAHGQTDLPVEARKGDAEHQATLLPDSKLAALSQEAVPLINSSHHQSIDKPGQNLRVTAYSTDGVIEGVEWAGDSNWVVGVQWHPERMVGDAFSERLFSDFVAAANKARTAMAQKP